MKSIYIIIALFASVLLNVASATSIRAEQININHANNVEFDIEMSFTEEDKRTCVMTTAPMKYKKSDELGLWVEIKDQRQKTIFNGAISALGGGEENRVRYSFCFDSRARISSVFIRYGVFKTGLVMSQFNLSALLKEL